MSKKYLDYDGLAEVVAEMEDRYVRFDTNAQNLDATEKANARTNIGVPTKTSDLTNDSGFITKSVNDLTNYYTKSQIDGTISSVYKPAGSVAFASLPTLAAGVLGNVYNVTDAFTTTSDFVEGAGKSYPAGTNVVVISAGANTYKFDVLAGMVDLSSYQTLITSSNKISADNVDDSSTTNKFVTAAEKTTWNGKQAALVSGTNIKTINGLSLLGSGNIDANDVKEITTATGIWTLNAGVYKGASQNFLYKSGSSVGGAMGDAEIIMTVWNPGTNPITTCYFAVMTTFGADLSTRYVLSYGKADSSSGTNLTTNLQELLSMTDVVDNLTSTEVYKPLSANMGKTLLEQVNAKQATLVSGTNIKTVNSQSLLGSGDLDVHDVKEITENTNIWSLDAGQYRGAANKLFYKSSSALDSSSSDVFLIVNSVGGMPLYTAIAGDRVYYGSAGSSLGSRDTIVYSTILKTGSVVNNLTSTSTTAPLSANMGKTLKDTIDNMPDTAITTSEIEALFS